MRVYVLAIDNECHGCGDEVKGVYATLDAAKKAAYRLACQKDGDWFTWPQNKTPNYWSLNGRDRFHEIRITMRRVNKEKETR